ncbi:MAG: PqqD family protein [Lachnospiraceae bacterium]
MAKKSENYLDYVPKHNSRYEWSKNEKGNVVLRVHNTGFFNRIAQLLFRKPKYSNIELDEFGSFVWEKIDGVRNVHEIGVLVRGHFGEKAEPLYERLAKFITILRNNGYVVYVNKM